MYALANVVIFIGLLLVAIGTVGLNHLTKKASAFDQKELMSKIQPGDDVLKMAAIRNLSLAGVIVQERQYGKGFIAKFHSLNKPFSTAFEYMAMIPEIREIDISTNSNRDFMSLLKSDLTSLDGLEALVSLEVITISDTKLQDLTPLAGLVNLTTLFISGNHIDDLTPLSDLPNLQLLSISQNPITDLTPLSSNINLRVLWAAETNISSLQPLITLPKLKELSLDELFGDNNIPIEPDEVERFRQARPDVKVSYEAPEKSE